MWLSLGAVLNVEPCTSVCLSVRPMFPIFSKQERCRNF